jgi:hypothetical protein
VFELTQADSIDVFIWEGKSRETALKAITVWNSPVEVGQKYGVDLEKGMLVVTVPKENVDVTNLEFRYWIDNNMVRSGSLISVMNGIFFTVCLWTAIN